MESLTAGVLAIGLAGLLAAVSAKGAEDERAKAIEAAAPDQAPAKPGAPRKVLAYGRVPTHGDSVRFCFMAIQALGKKTGAFETVCSGDPTVFLPESLKQFDAIVVNNTHESNPLLPEDFKKLPPEQQKAAIKQELVLKKCLIGFVAYGKGLVGIHGAACSVSYPDYNEMIGGTYAGHMTGAAWVKADDPTHPLCAMLPKEGFEANDEIYFFGGAFSRTKLRVLTSLDLAKTKDPGKRPDKDYAVSWIREYFKGRVFYCSLGHAYSSYTNPNVLKHILAGIQFAIGDLPADASPRPRP